MATRFPHIAASASLTDGPGHAEEIAARAVREGRGTVVAVGGDGTLHEVVNGLLRNQDGVTNPRTAPVLGLVPCGTANDFARALGFPKNPAKCLEICTNGTSVPIDLGRINGRYFINVAGFGLDAAVSVEVNRRKPGGATGTLPYLLAVLRLLPRYRPRALSVTVDGRTSTTPVLFGAVGNSRMYGGGMQICPLALPDDGYLDLCLAHNLTPLRTLYNLIRVFRGTHLKDPECSYRRAKEVIVSGDPCVMVHADGELLGGLPIRIDVIPRAIRLLTPPRRT